MSFDARALATTLIEARAARRRFEALQTDGRRLTLAQAYEVQEDYNLQRHGAALGEEAGHKVGLTSIAMQQLCGLDEPFAAVLSAGCVHGSGSRWQGSQFARLGVEAEIALRLKPDIPALSGGEPAEVLLGMIESVHPAFEIVDDRHADYADLDAATLVAENGWNVGIVVGSGVTTAGLGDLAGLDATLRVNGAAAEHGNSAAALGGPLNVLRWLGSFLSQRGRRLSPGQWIMTGSLVPLVFPAPGDRLRLEIDRIGAVEIDVD